MYHNQSEAIEAMKTMLYNSLPRIINDKWFNVVSFDNLAIEQLNVRRLMGEEQWNEFYLGNDGQFTMYVDMVNREFAKSSVSTERWPIMDNIDDMFNKVRNS